MVKPSQAGSTANRAIYLAIGVNTEGQTAALGLRAAATEGGKFWLSAVTELNSREITLGDTPNAIKSANLSPCN